MTEVDAFWKEKKRKGELICFVTTLKESGSL